jgi:hypothetical protein
LGPRYPDGMAYIYRRYDGGTREKAAEWLDQCRAEGLEYVEGLDKSFDSLHGLRLEAVWVLFLNVFRFDGPMLVVSLDGRLVDSVPIPVSKDARQHRLSITLINLPGWADELPCLHVDYPDRAIIAPRDEELCRAQHRAEEAEEARRQAEEKVGCLESLLKVKVKIQADVSKALEPYVAEVNDAVTRASAVSQTGDVLDRLVCEASYSRDQLRGWEEAALKNPALPIEEFVAARDVVRQELVHKLSEALRTLCTDLLVADRFLSESKQLVYVVSVYGYRGVPTRDQHFTFGASAGAAYMKDEVLRMLAASSEHERASGSAPDSKEE